MTEASEMVVYVYAREPFNPVGTILFVHGLGESGLCFEGLLARRELAAWRLLAPDIPGYGKTPCAAASPLSLADQADWLARWLTEHAPRPTTTDPAGRHHDPVYVLGHSMGGVVALLLAERHPGLISGIIDVDGNKSPEDCVFSSRAVQWDREQFAAEGFDVLREVVRRRGLQDKAQAGYHRSLLLADAETYHLNSRELIEMSAAEDMARRLAALPVPTLYIAGVPRGASPRTHELLNTAGVPVAKIEPSGHWPFIDQCEAFCRVVVDWLPA